MKVNLSSKSNLIQSLIKRTALTTFLCDDQSRQPFAISEHQFKNGLAKLSICKRSENVGFSSNFLTGLSDITDDFDYFAFSDQDDVWHRDKLDRAIKALGTVSVNTPALYCARTEISDAKCKQTLGFSPLFTKPPSFANALVQSISGGNTMVFNRAAKNLIVEASLNTPVVSHDWWCYQIITGAGGYVIYDPEPRLKYRQHGKTKLAQITIGAHVWCVCAACFRGNFALGTA